MFGSHLLKINNTKGSAISFLLGNAPARKHLAGPVRPQKKKKFGWLAFISTATARSVAAPFRELCPEKQMTRCSQFLLPRRRVVSQPLTNDRRAWRRLNWKLQLNLHMYFFFRLIYLALFNQWSSKILQNFVFANIFILHFLLNNYNRYINRWPN